MRPLFIGLPKWFEFTIAPSLGLMEVAGGENKDDLQILRLRISNRVINVEILQGEWVQSAIRRQYYR
ncbi:Uncharacterised protein [Vibrio cholerae]|nr:Uncharacterised protein [Vibrio cholerae]